MTIYRRIFFDGMQIEFEKVPLEYINLGGNIKVWNGTAFVAKPVKVWNGMAWVAKPLKTWNGTSWVLTNY